MGNTLVKKSFFTTGTFTAPGGVVSVIVKPIPTPPSQGSTSGNTGRAIDLAGNAYIWGDNSSGQIGDGTTVDKSSPIAVTGGFKFTQITGSSATCGIDLSGKLYGWGNNAQGAIADGTTANKSSPTASIGGLFFKKIATGTACLGLEFDGTVYGWGNNSTGALGLGDTVNRSSPVPVVGGHIFKNICCNGAASFFITTVGDLYSCGRNTSGQLGLGDVVPRSSPVLVLGGLNFIHVASFDADAIAITTDGTAYAWGSNANGEIGDGTTTPRSSPVAVLGGLKFKKVYATGGSSASHFGLAEDGTAYGWGSNESGQLGLGDVIPRSSPVAVLGGLKFIQLFASAGNAMHGLTADGKLYGWGNNGNGRLGVGDTVSRSSPVAVVGGITFAPVGENPLPSLMVPVTPGTSYSIAFNGPNVYFGDVLVGSLINGVEVYYKQ